MHTATAIKPHPGCSMTHGDIDLAAKWKKEHKDPVKSLRFSLSKHCWMIVVRPLPNKPQPKNIVDFQLRAF